MAASHKEVSTNPSANSVVSPTDSKVKAADIDRKMRVYAVFDAMRQGQFPSNNQIDLALSHVLKHEPFDTSKLSSDGQQLISDFQKIIETARKIVMTKNDDELMQNFLYATRYIDAEKLNPANTVDAPLNKSHAKQDGNQAAENLKTLGKLIFTNSEARKILKDIGLLARDVAADGAAKAAEVARPDEEQLKQVDQAAPENQWVGKDGEVRGPNDPVPDTGLGEKLDKAKQVKADAQNQAQQTKEEAKSHAQDAANRTQGAVQNAPGDSTDGPSEAEKEAAKREGRQVAEEKKNVVKDKANQLLSKIPQEHKDKAHDNAQQTLDKSKDYLKEKFPEERREQFIYRLKKVVVEQQRHPDYQDAVEFFLNLLETYHGHAKDVTKQVGDEHVNKVTSDPAFNAAYMNLRTLLERFANNASMQPILDASNDIYVDVQNDDKLRSWFKEADKFVRRVLLEPGYIMSDNCDKEGKRLRDDGQGFFEERYRPHREAWTNSIQHFFTEYAHDKMNVRFGEDWKRLTKDLLLDEAGNLTYKPQLWQDIRGVILPSLFKQIGYVPIPRIEYTDNMIDLVIENLTLEAANILPNLVEFEAKNYFKLSPYSSIKDQSKHSFWIEFKQIQTDLKDVAFYFKKKSGFPRISDSGLADVFIGGQGISGRVHLESTGRRDHVFVVKEVKVKIATLKFKIRDNKHNILFNMVKPIATGLIKKAVPKAIEVAIRNGLEQLDQQLSDIQSRLDDASKRDDVSRTDVLKNVFAEKKQQAEEKKSKADQTIAEREPQVKFVASRDSKILEWESKESMVGKQGKAQEKIHANDHAWKSEVFDIVTPPNKKPVV